MKPLFNKPLFFCGDAVHNLRLALDHAYWDIVSPFIKNDREGDAVQFPFSRTTQRLNEAITNRLANRMSDVFVQALRELKPHGEAGGNTYLYMVHRLDIIDKHMLLVPTADYTRLSSDILLAQIPEFPARDMISGDVSQSRRHVVWTVAPMFRHARRDAGIPDSGEFEKEIDVPVDIVSRSERIRDHTRSISAAIPCPTPMHIVAIARCLP
jgi:hypothetical protein